MAKVLIKRLHKTRQGRNESKKQAETDSEMYLFIL